jgi:hypothetical protein
MEDFFLCVYRIKSNSTQEKRATLSGPLLPVRALSLFLLTKQILYLCTQKTKREKDNFTPQETFHFVVTTWGRKRANIDTDCERGQRYCKTSYNAQESRRQQRIVWNETIVLAGSAAKWKRVCLAYTRP